MYGRDNVRSRGLNGDDRNKMYRAIIDHLSVDSPKTVRELAMIVRHLVPPEYALRRRRTGMRSRTPDSSLKTQRRQLSIDDEILVGVGRVVSDCLGHLSARGLVKQVGSGRKISWLKVAGVGCGCEAGHIGSGPDDIGIVNTCNLHAEAPAMRDLLVRIEPMLTRYFFDRDVRDIHRQVKETVNRASKL